MYTVHNARSCNARNLQVWPCSHMTAILRRELVLIRLRYSCRSCYCGSEMYTVTLYVTTTLPACKLWSFTFTLYLWWCLPCFWDFSTHLLILVHFEHTILCRNKAHSVKSNGAGSSARRGWGISCKNLQQLIQLIFQELFQMALSVSCVRMQQQHW